MENVTAPSPLQPNMGALFNHLERACLPIRRVKKKREPKPGLRIVNSADGQKGFVCKREKLMKILEPPVLT